MIRPSGRASVGSTRAGSGGLLCCWSGRGLFELGRVDFSKRKKMSEGEFGIIHNTQFDSSPEMLRYRAVYTRRKRPEYAPDDPPETPCMTSWYASQSWGQVARRCIKASEKRSRPPARRLFIHASLSTRSSDAGSPPVFAQLNDH